MSTQSRLAQLLKIGAIAGALAGVVRFLRGRRSSEPMGEASWPPLTDDPSPTQTSAPSSPVTSPTAASPTATPVSPTTVTETAWVEPVVGECPPSHPVKANEGSGIFHVPGGAFYDRTVPERCYLSPAAAEADGYRPSKR